MVLTVPSNPEMLNALAVSGKIGSATVDLLTSTDVIPPRLKNPPGGDRRENFVVLGQKCIELVLLHSGIYSQEFSAELHPLVLVISQVGAVGQVNKESCGRRRTRDAVIDGNNLRL